MLQSPQVIRIARAGVVVEASAAWSRAGGRWTVEIDSAEFDTARATADDAFDALCAVRAQLEPLGWRIGVAGAQPGVWPSGMSRDQGGGLVAYRMDADGTAGSRVDTFEAVDPETVMMIEEQRAGIERLPGWARPIPTSAE